MFKSILRSRLAHGLMTSAVFVLAACDSSAAVAPASHEPTTTSPAAPTTTTNTTPAPSSPAPTPPAASTGTSPFAGAALFAEDDTPASRQADAWRSSRPGDAAMMDVIAKQPIANWVVGGTSPSGEVSDIVTRAAVRGAVAVIVAYNIPNRDCGSYSAGGATASGYKTWIRSFASGIGNRKAAVILEPDALAGMTCLSATLQAERIALLKDAVETLKAAGATVYIDAGNAKWVPASEMAQRLQQVGIAMADGFALNVSNFLTTSQNYTYGDAISAALGGKHYVIDTSRNGNGGTADDQWCNPSGRALGAAPTTSTGHANVDALLWVKYPGESDGACNGGPNAGVWWADYALGLAKAATAMVATTGN